MVENALIETDTWIWDLGDNKIEHITSSVRIKTDTNHTIGFKSIKNPLKYTNQKQQTINKHTPTKKKYSVVSHPPSWRLSRTYEPFNVTHKLSSFHHI